MAFEDPELTNYEKQLVMRNTLFPEIPPDTECALIQALKFLNGGKDEKEGEGECSPRVYSFSKDADLIFAAFRQTHGIDLETTQMHWWKFLALFMDLGSDTAFCNLVSLRRRVKTGKATKEERQVAREMGNVFDVQEIDTRSFEEKEQEAEFFAALAH